MRILCVLALLLGTASLSAGAEQRGVRTQSTSELVGPGTLAQSASELVGPGTPTLEKLEPRACHNDPVCATLAQRGQAALQLRMFDEAIYFFEAAYGRSDDSELL